jgi:hypothetical protein
MAAAGHSAAPGVSRDGKTGLALAGRDGGNEDRRSIQEIDLDVERPAHFGVAIPPHCVGVMSRGEARQLENAVPVRFYRIRRDVPGIALRGLGWRALILSLRIDGSRALSDVARRSLFSVRSTVRPVLPMSTSNPAGSSQPHDPGEGIERGFFSPPATLSVTSFPRSTAGARAAERTGQHRTSGGRDDAGSE